MAKNHSPVAELSARATVFVPDGGDVGQAIARTTDLCIAAHQDDIEFMTYNAICDCYRQKGRWFTSCVVTDGSGSPRDGIYADYTNDEMKAIRAREQDIAAAVGEYSASVQLVYGSAVVKDASDGGVARSIAALIDMAGPEVVYTHNFADKHDTHVAVALRVVEAIRSLPASARPRKLYGMECWRGLDWVTDTEKIMFDASGHPNLAAALAGVFDSQIMGGKRYDLAILGRRAANATMFASHGVDELTEAIYALDMSSLIESDEDPAAYIAAAIERFSEDVAARIAKFA